MLKIIFYTILSVLIWLAFRYGLIYLSKRRKTLAEYTNALAAGNSEAYTEREKYDNWYPYKRYIPFSELPSLPIEQFIRFYSVDPSKWELTKGCAYRTDDNASAIFFQPFSNYLKYEKFRQATEQEYKKIKKEEEDRQDKINQDKNLEAVLALVQKDIDEAFEKSVKLREEAKEITEKVATNMNKQNVSD